MAEQVEITVASHPRWLRLVRNFVRDFAREVGFDRQESHSITLAVSEAVCNVLKHAYQGDTNRQFTIVCRVGEPGLAVEIRDDGPPFDPGETPQLEPDEIRPGGRGLFLIKTIMDEVEFSREGRFNVLRMKKLLPASACETS